jgi:hypothetical protein
VSDVFLVVDVELREQVVIAGGRVDFEAISASASALATS